LTTYGFIIFNISDNESPNKISSLLINSFKFRFVSAAGYCCLVRPSVAFSATQEAKNPSVPIGRHKVRGWARLAGNAVAPACYACCIHTFLAGAISLTHNTYHLSSHALKEKESMGIKRLLFKLIYLTLKWSNWLLEN
jgi:hypothetical protein